MIRTRLRRNVVLFLILLILSIIIHSLLVIVSFRHTFARRAISFVAALSNILSPEEKIKQKVARQERQKKVIEQLKKITHPADGDERPAKLTAPHSSFGWVLFDDTPPKPKGEPIEIPTTLDGDVGAAALRNATEEVPEPVITSETCPHEEEKQEIVSTSSTEAPCTEQAVLEQAAHPVNAQEEHQVLPEPPVTTVEEHSAEPASTKPATTQEPLHQTITGEAKSTAPVPAIPKEDLDKKKDSQQGAHSLDEHLNRQQSSSSVPGKQNQPTTRVRGAFSEEPKQKRNIIALTKGFVEKHRGESGTDLLDRDGDPDKKPSFEELKTLSYEAKLGWALQAAWHQNFSSKRSIAHLTEGSCLIEFTIDAKGRLLSSSLIQSSGQPELDTILMKTVKLASPFPPIPKHLKKDTFTSRRGLNFQRHYL